MRNPLVFVSIGLLLGASTCLAQTPAPGTGPGIPEQPLPIEPQPAEKVRSAALNARAPGVTIQQARARHIALQEERLAAQRSGDNSDLLPQPLSTGNTSGGLGDLLSGGLLGLLGGGNLTGLLDSLSGGTTTGNTTTGGDTNPNIPSNLTPEVLALLEGAGININDVFPASGTARSKDSADVAAAKIDSRSQAVADQPKFLTRWADAMLSAVFTAIVVGLQTPDVIDAFKDFLRPLLAPDTIEEAAPAGARLRVTDHARFADRSATGPCPQIA